MSGLSIIGTGRCLPEKIMTNNDWAKRIDTSDEWITSRTGIKQRFFCEGETNAELAAKAAQKAITQSGVAKDEIGLCMVATFTPDYATPAVACMVQKSLGLAQNTACLDINAACSGFVYGLQLAQGFLLTSDKPYALLIGSEVISKTLDFADRNTCILFGDGAGAAVICLAENKFVTVLGAEGNAESLSCRQNSTLQMNGKAIFRFAVEKVPQCIKEVLEKAGKHIDEIDYIVCHQANLRIISSVASRLKLPMDKFFVNVDRYGNTSAASIPLALDEMNEQGLLTSGKKIVCVGFGAGLTWGGAYIEF